MEGGRILKALRASVDGSALEGPAREGLIELTNDYERLVRVRNDITHARPATTPEGAQRLYRWAPPRTARTASITEQALKDFVDSALALNRRFDQARQQLKGR